MKRMHLIIVAFVIGLALCGWLTLRHAIRTAVTVPPVSDLPAPASSASKEYASFIVNSRTRISPPRLRGSSRNFVCT